MNTRMIASITLLTMALVAAGVRAEKPPAPAKPDFCIDLYKQLTTEKGNLFFSPFSIVTALAMTSAGAAGTTDAEMAAVLHLNPDQAKRHAECAAWTKSLQSANKHPAGGLEITSANALWCMEQMNFKKAFIDVATREYMADVRALDFPGNPAKAVDEINKWIEEKTRGKIKKILSLDAIGRDTRLVLTNAIYFKGDWSSPFKKELTREADFSLDGGERIKCPTMVQAESFNYAKGEGFAALEMHYEGDRMSMVILLPDKTDGLSDFEKRLTSSLVDSAIQSLARQQVRVYLPKFHAETRYNLGDYLEKMGMRLAFTADADFSGMTEEEPLRISAVIHKAFVDVDEKGTEAAAATAVVMERASARPPGKEPPVFRADHPFVYLIRDTQTGQVLFAGRMADPRK